jgi:hypothetical protein
MKLYLRYAVLTASVLLTACQSPKSLLAPPNNPSPVVLPEVPTSVINSAH